MKSTEGVASPPARWPLTLETVNHISSAKKEPSWMRKRRVEALSLFEKATIPKWGVDLSDIDFNSLEYYVDPGDVRSERSWDDVPEDIKKTFEALGIPEAERRFFSGVTAQIDSEVVYSRIQEKLEKLNVVFCSMEEGLRRYPKIVKEYFGTIVPSGDNKFAALNTSVWSGGSFVYVPRGVVVDVPIQAYFRIQAENMGQFERTLIVAEEDSSIHYIEGCTAPTYSAASLHSAVVEIVVKPRARVRYTTIQNWSSNVFNLVTKRMSVDEDGVGEWVDCNLGSRATMKYPSVILRGKRAKGEILSLAMASGNQHQDSGGKAVHLASETSSTIVSKSVSLSGGRNSYRGLTHIANNAENCRSHTQCDALIIDSKSRADTYPVSRVMNASARISHEATVSRISDQQLFYLQSRGISEETARSLIVNGFIEDIAKQLPMEYAAELNHLVGLSMEGAVG